MNDPLAPLKESIKHVPMMKYALAVVGLASAASMVFAYFKSIKHGIITMSVVLIFMILIILVTNIPKLKHIQFFVSAFLSLVLLIIFTLSGWFIWSIISEPGIVFKNQSNKQLVIDVENSTGTPVKQGIVRLKVTGSPEMMSEISKGIVTFPINNDWGSEDSATLMAKVEAHQGYIEKVSVSDLLTKTYKIKLQEKANDSVKVVFNLNGEFCSDLKTKISNLTIKTTDQQNYILNIKPVFSGKIEKIKENLFKYRGGHLIIQINNKQVHFENRKIDPIGIYYGSPKIQIEEQIRESIRDLTCSFTSDDIRRLLYIIK